MYYGVHSENAWIPDGFVCLLTCSGQGFVFGDSPKYKSDSTQFFLKMFCVRLARGRVPYAPVTLQIRS